MTVPCLWQKERWLQIERRFTQQRNEDRETKGTNLQAKPSKVAANGVLVMVFASSTSKKQETVNVVPSATISLEPNEPVTSKISNPNRAAKEFKLNLGAKIFSPSFSNKRSVTPPAMPAGANIAYVPDSYPAVPIATPQPEPYAHHRSVMVEKLGPVFYVHPLPQDWSGPSVAAMCDASIYSRGWSGTVCVAEPHSDFATAVPGDSTDLGPGI
ncbi:hypothetical protein L6452_34500 [Arctium lappa]|uniref:Uncharacterized protein n=1 Tax=Arctium lappa TaxID=4217 RepID=A0ACB8YJ41_ARCLA|nr:hypothetical protein L6452_34500 [Arctium lappa]